MATSSSYARLTARAIGRVREAPEIVIARRPDHPREPRRQLARARATRCSGDSPTSPATISQSSRKSPSVEQRVAVGAVAEVQVADARAAACGARSRDRSRRSGATVDRRRRAVGRRDRHRQHVPRRRPSSRWNVQRSSVPPASRGTRDARTRLGVDDEADVGERHGDAEAARLEVRLFQRPVDQEAIVPAAGPCASMSRTSSGRAVAPHEVGDRPGAGADPRRRRRRRARGERAHDEAGAVREIEAQRVVGRVDFRPAVRALAPAPVARRDAERAPDERARHHAARRETSRGRRRGDSRVARAFARASSHVSARARAALGGRSSVAASQ